MKIPTTSPTPERLTPAELCEIADHFDRKTQPAERAMLRAHAAYLETLQSHSVQTELLIQTLDAIRQCVAGNMTCKHPLDDGSDDPCDGEDCIKCYVLALSDAALPKPPEAR